MFLSKLSSAIFYILTLYFKFKNLWFGLNSNFLEIKCYVNIGKRVYWLKSNINHFLRILIKFFLYCSLVLLQNILMFPEIFLACLRSLKFISRYVLFYELIWTSQLFIYPFICFCFHYSCFLKFPIVKLFKWSQELQKIPLNQSN